MREDLTRYTCDMCKNTVTVLTGNYAGTPIHHKWIRVYKLLKSSDIQKTKLHFCCDNCARIYLNGE